MRRTSRRQWPNSMYIFALPLKPTILSWAYLLLPGVAISFSEAALCIPSDVLKVVVELLAERL